VSDDPREVAVGGLVQLRRRVDAHFAAAVERTPEAFACREGCSSCCVRFGVLEIEAERIRGVLARMDAGVRERVRVQGLDESATACALLVDGRCSVYEERPIICRSHGLPIRIEEDGESRVDVCRLNFVGISAPAPSVLVLDAVNAPLALIGRMWGGERISLAALAAESITSTTTSTITST
jgi:Fe-S-cluster containining protein